MYQNRLVRPSSQLHFNYDGCWLPAFPSLLKEAVPCGVFYGSFRVEKEVLARDQAPRANFIQKLADGNYDMLHFGGHGFFERDTPGLSALRFVDGDLTTDKVLEMSWKKPPSFVCNSVCVSGRGVANQRLVSSGGQSNGLAAAFLPVGVYAYAGYFWPVTEVGAGIFSLDLLPTPVPARECRAGHPGSPPTLHPGPWRGGRPDWLQRHPVWRCRLPAPPVSDCG